MCGIVGIIGHSEFDSIESYEILRKSLSEIQHRGPDAEGSLQFENVLFGHVRLSIIDLSQAGNQPMLSKGEDIAVSYNGEIYNYKEIRKNLDTPDSDFISETDTEVLIEFFREKGVESFKELNGMFAFSILDKKKRRVYLARDRFGIKPLYYSIHKNSFIFGSEIKALKKFTEVRNINENALPEWSYYGNTLQSETLFEGIKQVKPGHYLEVDIDTLDIKEFCYWSPKNINKSKFKQVGGLSEIISHTRSLLENAVKSQLVGDVPVGIFLSGGIDSSTVTAFASRHYPRKIDTFSVGFDFENGEGELPKAREVSELFNTNHHEIRVSGYDIADTVQKMVEHHDAPFSDAANIPLFLLGQQMKGRAKVVLQGDGGDEIFGGYQRYSTLAYRKLWKNTINFLSYFHGFTYPKDKTYYTRQRYINALKNKDEAKLMALLLTVEDESQPPLNIFSQNLRERIKHIDPFLQYRLANELFINENLVQRMLLTDTQLILPNIFLEKVDRSTMAASIEVRVPFLDNELSEFVLSLPSDLKIKRGQKKWLLKKTMEGLLPHNILYSKKQGFGVPFGLWLKGPLSELFNDKVLELQRKNIDILDWGYIEKIKNQNTEGHRDHSFTLWKVLNLMIWLSVK